MLGLTLIFGKPKSISKPPIYPYEFVTSGFGRVDEIRFLIEDQSLWDYCHDTETLTENNLQAAQRYGFAPSFTDEESALCEVLYFLKAGPHIMTYAWGLYADIIKSETNSH